MTPKVDQLPPVGPGFKPTPGLTELLNDDKLVAKLAVVRPELDRMFAQIQRDVVTEDNKDSIGPVVLALAMINNVFRVAYDRGDAVNQLNQVNNAIDNDTSD